MEKTKGMDLRAKDSQGNEVENFRIAFIGNLAFGVRNYNTTEREYLELFEVQSVEANRK